MEKKKINFSNIKGMLSNDQMKSIKGGSTTSCGTYCYILDYAPGTCGNYYGTCMCFGEGLMESSSFCKLTF